MIGKESSWDPGAHAPGSTASGLTQMIDSTAKAVGTGKANPRAQMEGGAKYLREQFDQFGSWDKALAAYNQGPGAANNPAGQQYARSIMASDKNDPHVDALLSLPDVGDKGGDAAPAADPHVDALLSIGGVQPLADTSDPKGNMDPRDIRQTQGYQDTAADAKPGWMQTARKAMAAVPAARAALELAQPVLRTPWRAAQDPRSRGLRVTS